MERVLLLFGMQFFFLITLPLVIFRLCWRKKEKKKKGAEDGKEQIMLTPEQKITS